MSFSIETLQDFALTLINDEAAKAAYAADPLGVLKEAGLSDLTPADMQEVLPLVADSLPPVGLPADTSGLPMDGAPAAHLPVDLPVDLPTGLGDLPVDLPVDLPTGLGDLPVDLPELPELGDLPSLGDLETPLGDLTAIVDTASTGAGVDLDGDVLSSATSAFLANPEDCDVPTVTSYTTSAVGDLTADATLDPEDFGATILGSTAVADAVVGLAGAPGGVTAWGGAETIAGDLGGALQAGPDGLAFATESPLGRVAADSDGEFSIAPADVSDLLDVDHLGSTGDAVAGTVAHYTSVGTVAITDGIESGGDTLAGFLTGPAAPVADVVGTATETVTVGVEQGGSLLGETVSTLPSASDLPLPQLPELPQLPDLPTIDSAALPQLGDITGHVGDLTDNLPLDTSSLPVDTSAVTDLVSSNPVTDVVHDSPVGGLVSGVTGHLPQVTDLTGDLDLGL